MALLTPHSSLATRNSSLATPEFTAHTSGGFTHTGPLEEVDRQWSVKIGGKKPGRAAGDSLISLRQQGKPLPDRPTGEQVVLANGDQVPGQVEKLAGEVLHFHAAIGEGSEWKLPLSSLSLIWVTAPDGTDHADRLRRRLLAGKRRRDIVLLRNGDALEGVLTGLDRERVRVEVDKRETAVGFDKLAVIALNTDLVRVPKVKGPFGRAVLADGARLSLQSIRADETTVTAKTLSGAEIQFPVADLVALDRFQGMAVYLSDLKPARYDFTPYLDEQWPWTADASVAGRDLRLAGSSYDKGIGMHSESRLTFNVPAGYQRFEALVGLDDETGREGNVGIQVLVDGKPQDLGRKELTGDQPPLPVRVNVEGAKQLTLVVTFGHAGPVQDHVDWVDARLIKKE